MGEGRGGSWIIFSASLLFVLNYVCPKKDFLEGDNENGHFLHLKMIISFWHILFLSKCAKMSCS